MKKKNWIKRKLYNAYENTQAELNGNLPIFVLDTMLKKFLKYKRSVSPL